MSSLVQSVQVVLVILPAILYVGFRPTNFLDNEVLGYLPEFNHGLTEDGVEASLSSM